MKEALIYINGKELSIRESMTLRVAITSYQMGLKLNGLGDDLFGKEMSDILTRNCESIISKIVTDQ